MSCLLKISQNFARDCDNPPVMGVEQILTLIAYDDLPKSGITKNVTTPNAQIDGIALNSGTQGYSIEGFKNLIRYTNSFVTSEDSINGVRHVIENIRVLDPSTAVRDQVNRLIAGAKVYAVLERRWGGALDAAAFLFFGIEHGLELIDFSDSSNENDGAMVLSLGTAEPFKEPYVPHVLLETNYETTKTAFTNLFAVA